jgi:hypothetical protein
MGPGGVVAQSGHSVGLFACSPSATPVTPRIMISTGGYVTTSGHANPLIAPGRSRFVPIGVGLQAFSSQGKHYGPLCPATARCRTSNMAATHVNISTVKSIRTVVHEANWLSLRIY